MMDVVPSKQAEKGVALRLTKKRFMALADSWTNRTTQSAGSVSDEQLETSEKHDKPVTGGVVSRHIIIMCMYIYIYI